MRRTILATIAACLTGSAAMAADLPVKTTPLVYAPPIADWSGFYVGLHGGYGWGSDPFDNVLFGVPLHDIHAKGWVWGGQTGYDWQFGQWVGGLESDLSGTGIRGSTSATGAGVIGLGAATGNSATLQDRFDLLGTERARLGFLALPNLLLYGTGGLAWTRFVNGTTTVQTITAGGITATTTSTSSNPTWRFGWVAGAGAEAKVSDTNWLVRLEYLHYDFGDTGNLNVSATVANIATVTANVTSGHVTADVVRAGLSYKFSAR
jgi:opacity protein-like surface antigen